MEHLSNDHEDCPNQHKNSHKLCDKMGHLVFSLTESQWKLRQQHDHNFPMEESIVEPMLASEERKKSKRAGLLKSQSGIRVGTLTN